MKPFTIARQQFLPAFVVALGLAKPTGFWVEYKSCLSAALAVVNNNPPTRAAKNQSLRDIKEVAKKAAQYASNEKPEGTVLTSGNVANALASAVLSSPPGRAATATKRLNDRWKQLHASTQDHLALIMQLTTFLGQPLPQRIADAADFIATEEKRKSREHYFWIEVQLAQAFVSYGGTITLYVDGVFAHLLRRFRSDCRATSTRTAPYGKAVGKTRIKQLYDNLSLPNG